MLKQAQRRLRNLSVRAGSRPDARGARDVRPARAAAASGGAPTGRYVIERFLPGAGALSDDDIHIISAKLNDVLTGLDGDVTWVRSYVTDDKFYCVYDAVDPELIRQHARAGGFPCDSVQPVRRTISPDDGR
ncbi:MAG: DUF4242 domain-containing protein [Nocardioidaceae bacterium]